MAAVGEEMAGCPDRTRLRLESERQGCSVLLLKLGLVGRLELGFGSVGGARRFLSDNWDRGHEHLPAQMESGGRLGKQDRKRLVSPIPFTIYTGNRDYSARLLPFVSSLLIVKQYDFHGYMS